jgi:transcriptional regulator with PAS, ATPase and Fis domain
MDFRICSVLCVPLMVRGELLGVIYLGNDNVVNLFTEEAREVATVFAAQSAMVLRNALLIHELQLSNQSLTQQIERMNFGSIIGASDSMRELFKKVEKVAGTDISVLVEGETGTGKELVASEIHRRSNRAKGPFVVINCGAIPENLLESELFGHVRGAFTGAVATRDGKFQAAHGGTLFLDEIGEMPIQLQVKLLRVLEDRKVCRVGETTPREIDIRVIAATNRNLAEEVKGGRFREDLYYRLNVVRLHLAALRDRDEDIMLLARYFLKRQADEIGVHISGFSEDATRAMHLHKWPGNIRELENRIKKAVIFCDSGTLSATDLDLDALQSGRIEALNDAKEGFARGYVRRVLEINGGNRTQTAKDLGVDVRTIYRYLEREKDGELIDA